MSATSRRLIQRHVERRARQEEPFLRRLPGGRGAGGGAAVKALFDGGDVRAAGAHLERHLERVLVGLGAGVDPEHAVERQLRKLQQLLRGARADFHRHGIGLEIHLRGLIGSAPSSSPCGRSRATPPRGRRTGRAPCGHRACAARRRRRRPLRWDIARRPARGRRREKRSFEFCVHVRVHVQPGCRAR